MHLRNGKLVLGPDGNPSTLTSTTVSAPSTPSFPLFVGARLSLLHSETSPRRAESQPLSPIGGDHPVPLETVDMDLPTGKPEEAGVDAALGRPRRWDPVGEPPFARYDEHTGSMNDFLMVFELWCKRRGLPQREWCMLLPHYLSGAALRYWIHLFRSDEGQMDWESLKKLLLRVFDSRGRYKQGLALKELRWKGDSQTFIDEFLAVVALGEYCTPAELLAAFLTLLPAEVCRNLTQNGARRFEHWREAADALTQQETEWTSQRAAWASIFKGLLPTGVGPETAALPASTPPGQIPTKPRFSEAQASRCDTCGGTGHLSDSCPVLLTVYRREGARCFRCGGRNHYASVCTTKAPPARGGHTRLRSREVGAGDRPPTSLNDKA